VIDVFAKSPSVLPDPPAEDGFRQRRDLTSRTNLMRLWERLKTGQIRSRVGADLQLPGGDLGLHAEGQAGPGKIRTCS